MFFAAAEERGDNLLDGRGDAYCGMLNASYNLKLRGMKAYIPEYPVGNAEECAEMLHELYTSNEANDLAHSLLRKYSHLYRHISSTILLSSYSKNIFTAINAPITTNASIHFLSGLKTLKSNTNKKAITANIATYMYGNSSGKNLRS